MCYEENATGHYCTLTGQGESAIAADEGYCVPYSVLLGSGPFFIEKGIRPHAFFDAWQRFIHAWRGSTVSTKVDTYPHRPAIPRNAAFAFAGAVAGQRPARPTGAGRSPADHPQSCSRW
ncbi:hypothetical protein CEE63_19110 [Stenotrophomonas maltophilia]|uniref:Uncharacterized protein n=1 Tax=Stenotrophomonas maltophilia TaxID=40324 RepID=A0A246HY49_STEMA|nr:hypothetical protein CEE63_19110 [Stenotrophomonas maltophilia]